MSLSLVIPLHNEERNIRKVAIDLSRTLERSSIDYELILVNNGSTDKTSQALENLAREKPDAIKLVHISANQGYGWGVISGLREVTQEYVGFMGGDGQVEARDVLRVYSKLIDDNLDLCQLRRVLRKDGPVRRFISYCYNLTFRFLFSWKVRDINATPKIMRRELCDRLDLVSKDWFLDAEVIIKCAKMRCKIAELPAVFHERETGQSGVNFWTILEFLKNMIKYRIWPFESRQ